MGEENNKQQNNKKGADETTNVKVADAEVLERFKDCTLLEINIETGRTHQIRVHLSHIGYPIIGDDIYSNGKNKWGIVGQCLHAKSLDFKHPITGKQMHIDAELPEYLQDIFVILFLPFFSPSLQII